MLEFTRKQEHQDHHEPYLNEGIPHWSAIKESTFVPIPSWEQHLDLLTHLSRYSKVLLAVIGEAGVGKSTLLEQMRMQANEIGQVYDLAIPPQFDLQQLSHLLLQAFNVAPSSATQDPMSALLEQLEQLQMRANPSILLLDDAQLIPLETLAGILSLLEQLSEQLVGLHVVLFGTPRLLQQLDHLGQQYALADLVHVVTLEPLSLAETENYLHNYFEYRNFAGSLPLSQERINQLFEESRGLPAKISLLAADAFEQATSFSTTETEAALFPHFKKLLGAGILGIAIFVLLLWQKQLSQWFSISNTDSTEQPAVMTIQAQPDTVPRLQPAVIPPPSENSVNPMEANELNAPQNSASVGPIEFSNPTVSPPVPVTKTLPPASIALPPAMPTPASPTMDTRSNANLSHGASLPKVSNPEVAKVVPTVVPKAAVVKPVAKVESAAAVPQVNVAKPVVRPVPVVAARNANVVQPVVRPVPVVAAPNANVVQPVARAVPVVAAPNANVVQPVAKAIPVTAPPVQGFAQSSGQNGRFALQLSSVGSYDRAQAFIAENKLEGSARALSQSSDGNQHYVVLYGQYATREEAQAAQKILSTAHPDLHPWIRHT